MLSRLVRARRAGHRADQSGFTLIELLVVIVILAILAAVVVFAVGGVGDRGQASAYATDADTLRTAQEAHCARYGTYANMATLVQRGFLSEPSTLHPEILLDNGGEISCARTGNAGNPGGPPAPGYALNCDPAVAACGSGGGTGKGVGRWVPTGKLINARRHHSATLLTNGKVLVAGGRDGLVPTSTLTSAELYDPVTGTWTATGSMNEARWNHTAVLLTTNCGTNCGKVLVAGGTGGNPAVSTNAQPVLDSAELYNPVTGTWTPTDSLNTRRSLHSDAVLADGRVLVAGGRTCTAAPPTTCNNSFTTKTAEIYDPAAETWTSTSDMAFSHHTNGAALLNDGRVIVAGGFVASPGTGASVQIYNPAANSWTTVASMNVARSRGGAIKLSDGRVMVAAGTSTATVTINNSEIYNPTTNTWALTGLIVQKGRTNFHHKVLPSGRVLVAGGGESGFSAATNVKSAEIYDPIANSWTSAGHMRDFHGTSGTAMNTQIPEAILLTTNCGANCGKVLVAGNNSTGTADLYDPNG